MSTADIKRMLRPFYVPVAEKAKALALQVSSPLRIMTAEETIDYILKNRCSVSRYGDGEFNIAFHDYGVNFQGYHPNLSRRLREVLAERDDRVLVCIPRSLRSRRGMNRHARTFWRHWLLNNYRGLTGFLYSARGKDALYGDADITRPYMNWNGTGHAERVFGKLKKLWEGKDLLIVEGEQTRLGVGNDLLRDARSIKRILCPPTNAFENYDEILRSVLERWSGETVMIALGPTATVLAADLAVHDIQALDVGHVDIEYEWMLRRSSAKEQIPGKYTNEANSTVTVSDCGDACYLGQIIARIGSRTPEGDK